MKLIIAEKPSLARTIAKSLGKYKNHTEDIVFYIFFITIYCLWTIIKNCILF